MVPQTYPSVYNTYTNRTEMVVYELTSISGKVRWTDYIPVKLTTSTNAAKDNTTDSDGCIPISPLGSITNKQAFTDYIPIYVDNSATDAWAVSATGYIPYGISGAATTILRRPGIEAHVYLPGIGTLSGLQTANYLDSALTTPATVDNPVGGVVDAIGVINATQPTTAAKPRLERGVRNLLTYSQDFSNVAYGGAGVVWSAAGIADPIGGSTAGSLTASLADSNGSRQFTPVANTPYTFSVWLKTPSGTNTVNIYLNGGGILVSTVCNVTTTWQRFSVTGTPSTTASMLEQIGGAGTISTGEVLHVFGLQLEVGSIASDYSPTTTAAASNPSAGKYSWAFDGGDSLALGSVPFQMSDDFSVHIAARLDTAGATRTLYSHSNVSNHQIPWVYFNATGNLVWTSWDGTTSVNITSPSTYIGVPIVIRARKIGNTGTLWINGVQVATASLAAVGSPALTSANIGSFNTAALQHIGTMGFTLPLKGTQTDAEGLTIDRLVASNFPNAPSF